MGPQRIPLLFLLLTCFTLSISSDDTSGTSISTPLKDSNSAFEGFKLTYNKVYKSEDEENRAKEAYTVNMAKIEAHNQLFSQGKVSYSLGSNQFLDESLSNIVPNLAGIVLNAEEQKLFNWNVRLAAELNVSLPDSVDYSSQGVVTPVGDQDQCGSVWAFAATGTMESIYALKTGTLLDLSEQQLLDCSSAYGNSGCDGGSMAKALSYAKDAKGLVTEEDYPYIKKRGLCNTSILVPEKLHVKLKGTGYILIPKGDATAMQNAVANVGPIAVALHVVDSFFLYKSGIYSEMNCNPEAPNTALLIVGYGVDPKTNLTFWKARNSWGSSWGEGGYIRILRGRNVCGIENFGVYADLDPSALPTSSTTTLSPDSAVETTDFELQPSSYYELTTTSEFVVSALTSVAKQFSINQDRFSKARGIMNDLETKYNRRFRVIVGTAYSFSGAYASPNYLVLKQKNTTPAVFITIAQATDCSIECGKGPVFFLDSVNPVDFKISYSDSNMGNADKQVILDYYALALRYFTIPSHIAKYISNNLQNVYGSHMDVIIGTDYDSSFFYRMNRYMAIQKNEQSLKVYAPDCYRLKLTTAIQPVIPKSWWTYDENSTYAGMCGKNAPLYDGRYPVCNPEDDLMHCCNTAGRCGAGPAFCACNGCRDYADNTDLVMKDAVAPSRPLQWFTMADDLPSDQPKCGVNAPRINVTLVAICNPDDPTLFCCSSAGFCGNTSRFCDCIGCVNFQKNPNYNYP